MDGEQDGSASSPSMARSWESKSRLSDEVECPPGDCRDAAGGIWLTGPSGPVSWLLALSVSGPLGAGDVTPVALDCGPGEMVVARDDGSTDVWPSSTRDSGPGCCSLRLS